MFYFVVRQGVDMINLTYAYSLIKLEDTDINILIYIKEVSTYANNFEWASL